MSPQSRKSEAEHRVHNIDPSAQSLAYAIVYLIVILAIGAGAFVYSGSWRIAFVAAASAIGGAVLLLLIWIAVDTLKNPAQDVPPSKHNDCDCNH